MEKTIKGKKSFIIIGAGTAGLIAALMIREKYPEYIVRVVKSDKIGIVGVGEGSTEHWASFMKYVGIPHDELIVRTGATIKIGILFKDWIIGKRYAHSLGGFEASFSGKGYLEVLNRLYTDDANYGDKEFRLAPEFEVFFSKNRIPFGTETPANQFHFDTFKLNEYLSSLCRARGVDIVDAEVTHITPDTETGYIYKISSSEGAMEADFYIDCTGFKRLFSEITGNKWKSLVEYLPMNRAIAFPTPHVSKNFEPYTTATALSSGWSWRIPTQERYGNGYVFNNSYISADDALEEIKNNLGLENVEVGRDIPFEAGKLENFWVRNVLFLGLAGSFAEPLEAQSIGFTIVQMFKFLDYFDIYEHNNEKGIKKYNEDMNDCFQNVVDYLQAHYFTTRDDSKFWKDKPFKLTDFNAEYYGMFKHGKIIPSMFKDYNMFKSANWYQVLGGLGIIQKFNVINGYNNHIGEYNIGHERKTFDGFRSLYDRKFVTHEQFLETVTQNYKEKIFFEKV